MVYTECKCHIGQPFEADCPVHRPPPSRTLPTDAAERKKVPLYRGLFRYFPAALAEVARLSQIGNEQHNPGEDMYWARRKSADHGDCILRHQMDISTDDADDTDGVLHEVKVAWRALAQAQIALEKRGAPRAPAAR